MPRSLTPIERVILEENVGRWLQECQRWMDLFEVQADKFSKELLGMEADALLTGAPSTTDIVTTASYFIMAAGCVLLHCESIVEAKHSDKKKPSAEARKWIALREDSSPVLKALVERRNWMNHGALYAHENYRPGIHVHQGQNKTFKELIAEAMLNGEAFFGDIVTFHWTEEKTLPSGAMGQPSFDILEWHKKVVIELGDMIKDIKAIPLPV